MSGNAPLQIIRFADFEIDFTQREIRKRGTRIHVQHKPFQILQLLLRCPGVLVTREEIARTLWPDLHVSFERCLNTAVNSLRQALGDSSNGARFIETRSGSGYVFIAKVERIADSGARQHDYLKGRYLLDKGTEGDTRKAVAYFESALHEGGCSALAYAALADAECELARLSCAAAHSSALKARNYADLALGSDSRMAEPHVARARVTMLFDWDWNGAQTEFIRALELNEQCAAAHRFYASLLTILHEHSLAVKHVRTAESIEPVSLPTSVDLAWNLYFSGDYNSAAEQCWRILALEPRFWWAQLALGLSYQQLGMREEAAAELENAVTCSGGHPVATGALRDRSADAIQIFFGCLATPVTQ